MSKKLLIVGCSHAAGFEINGEMDSAVNRSKSFGNQLAGLLDMEPINIAIGGASNATIARNAIEYLNQVDRKDDFFVLIAWSESSRIEVPILDKRRYQSYDQGNPYSSNFLPSNNRYLMINPNHVGKDIWYRIHIPQYQRFVAKNTEYLEIHSANLVLMLQNFFKVNGMEYMMCNTMHMFTSQKYIDPYFKNFDKSRYLHCLDNSAAFYTKYKDLGYENPKAIYWHHGEEAHRLYADELFDFYKNNYLKN